MSAQRWSALWAAATRGEVLIALVVGTILAIVNHGPALLAMHVPPGELAQILVSYLVPFCVATWSAAAQAMS